MMRTTALTMMLRLAPAALVAALTLGVAATVVAEAPQRIPVQGTLYDGDGRPIDGSYTVEFVLYADADGRTPIWVASRTVEFVGGLFNVYLGEESPLNLVIFRDYDAVYVGMSVDGDEELGPWPLATSPWAGWADHAGDADTLNGSTADEIESAAVERAILDGESRFAAAGHRHRWAELLDLPAGFADGIDDVLTEAEVDAYVANNGFQTRPDLDAWALDRGLTSGASSWDELTGIPPGFADGIDNTVDEPTVDAWVNDNGFLTSGTVRWTDILAASIPAGFRDGVDNTVNEATVDAWANNNGYARSGSGVETYDCALQGFINDWDGMMNYTCPDGRVLGGMYSVHDNGKEDRRFRPYCCLMRIR